MSKVLERRPSAAMVVALIALVVALSGSAVAATRLVSGDRLIRKGTLSGNRLRKHTLTGTQINLKKLGTVPNAKKAGTANTAGTAGHAITATSATNASFAANAAQLAGQPASSFLSRSSRIGTKGIVTVQGSAAGNTVTLFTDGPFTMTMTCTMSGSDTSVGVDATTSEAGSDLNGVINPPVDTPEAVGPTTTPTGGAQTEEDFVFSFEAPSGAQAILSGSYGANSVGVTNGCWANLAGIQ